MNPADAQAVTTQIEENPATWAGVHLLRGKMVLELTVVTTNKGRALKALMKANHCTATVFIGDDVTDENAFGVLVDGDVGIKVGLGPDRRGRPDRRSEPGRRRAARAGRQPAAGAEAPLAACRRHVRAGGEGADVGWRRQLVAESG